MATPVPQWPLLSGSAAGASASLSVAGHTTTIGPFGPASGSAPPAFDHWTSVASARQDDNLDPSSIWHPAVWLDAQGVSDDVSSKGFGVDNIALQASADIKSATLVLTDNPLSALSVLGLSVTATFIHASADASYLFGANRGFLNGSASFGSLTIAGALIGRTLTFKGNATANDVIFHNDTVTVTLDKQAITGFFPPGAAGATSGSRITTDALDIQLNNAHLFGQTISGNIDIGQASATLWPRHA